MVVFIKIIKTAQFSTNHAVQFLPTILDPLTTCFPTLTPQHALFITTDTAFSYFSPTSCLSLSPFPFPSVVWSSLPWSQLGQVALTDPFTIRDPRRTSVVSLHDTAVSRRGRHQAVPHKHGHSERRLLQCAVWVSSQQNSNTLCYLSRPSIGYLLPSGAPSGASSIMPVM